MADSNRSRATRAQLARWRRGHLGRYAALLQLERQGPTRAAGELRTAVEAEAATLMHHRAVYRADARAYNAVKVRDGKHWDPIKPAERKALWAVWMLDTGKAWATRLGGTADAYRLVARQYAAQAPESPQDGRNGPAPAIPPWSPLPAPVRSSEATSLAGIPEAAWLDALQGWHRWPDPTVRRKGGRPKAGSAVYRPGAVLLQLLRAGRIKRQRPRHDETARQKRDAEGLRAKVDASVNTVRGTARKPHPGKV